MRCTEETLTPLDRLEARHAQPRITRVAPARPAYRPSTQRNPVTQQIVGRPGQIGDLSDELRLNPMHAGKNERGFEAGLARRHMQVNNSRAFWRAGVLLLPKSSSTSVVEVAWYNRRGRLVRLRRQAILPTGSSRAPYPSAHVQPLNGSVLFRTLPVL
jgi:hypothetical protein